MIVFADSSAVVTKYTPTENDVLADAAVLVVSAIARVEVASAIWRKLALGEVPLEVAGAALRAFDADWTGSVFRPIVVATSILERAAKLTGTHGLRSLDAIQLASALAGREVEPEMQAMVVLDARLRVAAAAEGFELLPR